MLVTARAITAGDPIWHSLTEHGRDELRDLTRAHGFHPSEVKRVEHDVIDCPLLRFTLYETDERGHKLIRPGTHEMALRTIETVPRVPLPAWWHPDAD